jgi:hypothetical protein
MSRGLKSMLHRIIWIALLIALVVLDGSAFGSSGRDPVSASSAGISQLVEDRNGQVSCWGVVVQLRNMTFKRSIVASQIRIVEAKHGHNLTDIMVWSVGKKGKRLTVRFKENAGDFGTGNVVQIDIDRSAFVGPIESGNLKFEWAITTDPSQPNKALQLTAR